MQESPPDTPVVEESSHPWKEPRRILPTLPTPYLENYRKVLPDLSLERKEGNLPIPCAEDKSRRVLEIVSFDQESNPHLFAGSRVAKAQAESSPLFLRREWSVMVRMAQDRHPQKFIKQRLKTPKNTVKMGPRSVPPSFHSTRN